MTDRAARAAEQSDPALNRHFRRAWGFHGATGPDATPIRAWHSCDVAAPPMSRERKAAERAWSQIVRRAAP